MFNVVLVPAIFGIALGVLFKALGGAWWALVIPSVVGILISVVFAIVSAGMTM